MHNKPIKLTELPVVGYAVFLLLIVRIGLSISSFRVVCDWVLRPAETPEPLTDRVEFERAIYLFNCASRFVPATTCLVRSTAGRRFFPRLGFVCRLCIGTRHDEHDGFEAHAWLERNGEAFVGDEVAAAFSLLYSPDDAE